MSETWTMPTWMREILLAINPNMNEPEWARVVNLDSEPNTYRDEDPYLAETMAETELLESLRAAELLFTPGENDMHARAYDQACKDITRLRAENADLLENYKRADRGLRECCDSKERIRAENERLMGDNRTLLGGHALVYCAFCGERFVAETDVEKDALLLAHIEVCKKHPIAELKAENERLRDLAILGFYEASYIESGFDKAHATEIVEAWLAKLFDAKDGAERFDKYYRPAYARLSSALGGDDEKA